jgi:hypothetical protein
MGFLQSDTCDDLRLLGADMCNLRSMTGLGNFGAFYLGTMISRT